MSFSKDSYILYPQIILVRTYFNVDNHALEEKCLTEILPVFTQDLPQNVLKTYTAVPMDLCMATLMITSIIKGSIQEAVQVIDDKKKSFAFTHSSQDLAEDYDWDAIHYAHPNDIRKTLIAWPRSQIASRYRKINRELIRELKKSKFFQKMHANDGMTAAFDVTQVDYYGADDDFTLFTHGRTAAKRCHAYLSLQIVCPGFRLVLDVEPIFKDTKPLGKIMTKMLRRMRRYGLKFKNIYLDMICFDQLNARKISHSLETLTGSIWKIYI